MKSPAAPHMPPVSTQAPVARGADPTRALGLFLVRESDQYNLELFNAMREVTYLQYRDIPAVEAIRRAGLKPLKSDSFRVRTVGPGGEAGPAEPVRVEYFERGGTRALLFYFGGYWHLWSRASAAMLSKNGVNEFTDILIEVIERIRPLDLYAANFSRLIRSQAQGHRLMAAMAGNVQRVRAGEVTFELEGPRSNVDMMMFSMFAMVASMERNWIVQRLLAGRVAKWRRGEWPFGRATIPFGYTLEAKTQRLVPDPSKRAAVREMLLVLSGDAPTSEMARQLSRVGVVTSRPSSATGKHLVPVALVSKDAYVKSLYGWAAVWCQGEFLFRISNVFRDLDELSGLHVARDPSRPDDVGELQMLYKVGVPEGGWAEPEVLRAFAQKAIDMVSTEVDARRRHRPRPLTAAVRQGSSDADLHGQMLPSSSLLDGERPADAPAPARARQRIAPWTGRKWIDGDFFYELRARDVGRYYLLRWPLLRRLIRSVDVIDADDGEYDDMVALLDAETAEGLS